MKFSNLLERRTGISDSIGPNIEGDSRPWFLACGKAQVYRHETFPNAPIVEALLNFVVPATEYLESRFDRFCGAVKNEYPTKEVLNRHQGMFRLNTGDGGHEFRHNTARQGYILRSSDGYNVVQVRNDGLQLSRLKPYQNFEFLSSEAFRLWEIYTEIFEPSFINQLALRYINRLMIPLPLVDFKEYISTGVEIASGLPQGVSELFFRVVLHPIGKEDHVRGIVTSTIEPIQDSRLPYIFDIDVSKSCHLNVTDQNLAAELESLRDFKNDIFFESMTEKAREMFR